MWTPLHEELLEHPKVYALAEALRVPKAHAIGIVTSMWLWALRNAVDGDLSRFPTKAIASSCDWGKPGARVMGAMVACGWIDPDGKIHDWRDYASRLMEISERAKEKTKERVRKHRSNQTKIAPDGDNDVTRYKSVTCNDVTPPTYTETYTETKTEGRNTAASIGAGARAREAGAVPSRAGRVPTREEQEDALIWAYGKTLGPDERWDAAVRGGVYSLDQLRGVLEYLQRRKEQGVLRDPFAYGVRILEDWRGRGLDTAEAIEAARLGWEGDAEG